jgi:hypothetical protein
MSALRLPLRPLADYWTQTTDTAFVEFAPCPHGPEGSRKNTW